MELPRSYLKGIKWLVGSYDSFVILSIETLIGFVDNHNHWTPVKTTTPVSKWLKRIGSIAENWSKEYEDRVKTL